jgi:predicted alpha/beta-fold hydrolase
MVRGHLWTIGAQIGQRLLPGALPDSRSIETVVDDPRVGAVRLESELCVPEGAERLMVLIHGLGGSSRSRYQRAMTESAFRAGYAVLRVNLRGADLRGEDFYHAGLSTDLEAIITHPALMHFEHVVLVGYSLGGHLALHYATGTPNPRVEAVITVCSPFDLARASASFDRDAWLPYRLYVLGSLKAMARAVAARRPLPISLEDMERIQGIGEWDD